MTTSKKKPQRKPAPAPSIGRRRSSFHSLQIVQLGFDEELDRMRLAEREQRRVDRFWGLDLQADNEDRERFLMTSEDFLSHDHRTYFLNKWKQARWEVEQRQSQYEEAYRNSVAEMEQRRLYISSLFATDNTMDVIGYKWGTRPHVAPATSKEASSKLMFETEKHRNSKMLLLDPEVALRNVSLHLDGVQQGKAVSSERNHDKLGPTLRSRSIQNVVEEALQSPSILNPSAEAARQAAGRKGPSLADVPLLSQEELLASAAAVGNKHFDALDGHVQFKWDQEILLRIVFNKLDVARKGFLTLTDLSRLASNAAIQSLLRYTVFSSWIKRKQWRRFVLIAHPVAAELASPTRRTTASSVESAATTTAIEVPANATISLSQWIEAAVKSSRAHGVIRRHIRTEAEHHDFVMENLFSKTGRPHPHQRHHNPHGQHSRGQAQEHVHAHHPPRDQHPNHHHQHGSPSGWFARGARSALIVPERDARVSREIREGDVVWGLHGRGVVWLPALVEKVVERLNPESGDVTMKYHLSYFLSQNALQKARAVVTSRQLLEHSIQSILPPSTGSVSVSQVGFSASSQISTLNQSLHQKSVLTSSSHEHRNGDAQGEDSSLPGSESSASQSQPRVPAAVLTDERSLCGHLFDLLQHRLIGAESMEGSSNVPGSIPTSALLSVLQGDPYFGMLARHSVCLSSFLTLRSNAPSSASIPESTSRHSNNNKTSRSTDLPSKAEARRQHLQEAFRRIFPDFISKVEFLEFCSFLLDIATFSSVLSA